MTIPTNTIFHPFLNGNFPLNFGLSDLLGGVVGHVLAFIGGHAGEFDDEIERICEVDPLTGKVLNAYTVYVVYPASGYATSQDIINRAADTIEEELEDRLDYFEQEGKLLEKGHELIWHLLEE